MFFNQSELSPRVAKNCHLCAVWTLDLDRPTLSPTLSLTLSLTLSPTLTLTLSLDSPAQTWKYPRGLAQIRHHERAPSPSLCSHSASFDLGITPDSTGVREKPL